MNFISSKRQEIRSEVKRRLGGNTKAGNRVNRDRVCPYIEVSTPRDTCTLGSSSSRMTFHNLQLVVTACDTPRTKDADVFDQLDSLAEEVQAVIDEDETLGGVVTSCVLKDVQMDKNDEGNQVYGFIQLVFDCEYQREPVRKPEEYIERQYMFEDFYATR